MVRGKVIRDSWAEHHRTTAEHTMTGYVRIYAPDVLTYNEEERMNISVNGALRWEGSCRVQQHNFESSYLVGDQIIKSRAYLIAIPAEVDNVQINDVARFSTLDLDTSVEMLIVSVQKGSERFQRDMTGLDRQQLNIEKAAV